VGEVHFFVVQDLPFKVSSYLASQEITCFYETWNFITVFTVSRH